MSVLVPGLGVLTVMLDSAVNIAFPAISGAFGVPATSIQWVVLTYIGAFAAALVPAGRLVDRAGPGRVFRAGLGVTGVAHGLAGLAPSWEALLGARVVQGLGAALVMASAPALVTLATPAQRRGWGLGRLGLAASVGMVVGPLLGGVLVGALGWRIVYLGRLPLVVMVLALARQLEAGADGCGAPAGHPAASAVVAGTDRDVLLTDLRAFVAAHAAQLLANAAFFAIWLLVPYDLIDRRGLSPALGGLLFTTAPLAWACATPLAGRLADRGAGQWLAPSALAMEAAGLWCTGRLGEGASAAALAAALGLGGLGYGLFLVPNMHYVMSALPPARQGVAGSLVALMRTTGIVVGANVTTAVYAARLSAHATRGLGPTAAAPAAFGDALVVAAAIALAAGLLTLVPPRGAPRLDTRRAAGV
jgi:MFS family permease